jgi:hypothetical protein
MKKPLTFLPCSPDCPICEAIRFNKTQKAIFFFVVLPAFLAVIYYATTIFLN